NNRWVLLIITNVTCTGTDVYGCECLFYFVNNHSAAAGTKRWSAGLHARLLALGIIKCQCVPTILATACVGQNITRHLGQAECVVEFAISQQPSIGGHQGAP